MFVAVVLPFRFAVPVTVAFPVTVRFADNETPPEASILMRSVVLL